tara:strand:- start:1072 stop:1431 length:360 start_codon:yes stop_codon:yes gene_type:complete
MKVVIQGNKLFDSYEQILRGLGTALHSANTKGDKEFIVFCAGPTNITDRVKEFLNVSENSLKAYKVRHKLVRVPPKWIMEHSYEVDYMIYFAMPKEPIPEVVKFCDRKDIENFVYRQYQ